MSGQLAIAETGTPTPPELRLGKRQRFALECLATKPLSSQALGALLHEVRMVEGGVGHHGAIRCEFCQGEGAHMGSRLRELGLVRFSRKLDVWYVLAEGSPRVDRGAQTDEIPF